MTFKKLSDAWRGQETTDTLGGLGGLGGVHGKTRFFDSENSGQSSEIDAQKEKDREKRVVSDQPNDGAIFQVFASAPPKPPKPPKVTAQHNSGPIFQVFTSTPPKPPKPPKVSG